jgi:hypothetical protein
MENLRVLAGGVDGFRVVLAPRPQDDPVAPKLHA